MLRTTHSESTILTFSPPGKQVACLIRADSPSSHGGHYCGGVRLQLTSSLEGRLRLDWQWKSNCDIPKHRGEVLQLLYGFKPRASFEDDTSCQHAPNTGIFFPSTGKWEPGISLERKLITPLTPWRCSFSNRRPDGNLIFLWQLFLWITIS